MQKVSGGEMTNEWRGGMTTFRIRWGAGVQSWLLRWDNEWGSIGSTEMGQERVLDSPGTLENGDHAQKRKCSAEGDGIWERVTGVTRSDRQQNSAVTAAGWVRPGQAACYLWQHTPFSVRGAGAGDGHAIHAGGSIPPSSALQADGDVLGSPALGAVGGALGVGGQSGARVTLLVVAVAAGGAVGALAPGAAGGALHTTE